MSYDFKGNNAALVSSINALLALDAKGALAPHGIGEMARQLLEASSTRLAEQHQDKPVVLPGRKPWNGLLATADNLRGEGWNTCLDEIAKLGPLYNHADPVEVERLRAEVGKFRGYCVDLDSEKRELEHKMDAYKGEAQEYAALRAQLATLTDAASALIATVEVSRATREEQDDIYTHEKRAMDELEKVLAASAAPGEPKCKYCGDTGQVMVGRSGDANDGNAPIMEPCEDCDRSAPVERDEPVAWFTDDHLTDKSATTWDNTVADRWRAKGWPVGELFARAALERKASDDIPDFTPGNGNKAERRATALLDQLQADLTALDEKLDQTQDLLRYMVHDYRSVVQAGYDKITSLGSDCDSVTKVLADNPNYQKALALLMPDLESRPEERGTPETEPCSGCGTPGWTAACNKCVPY